MPNTDSKPRQPLPPPSPLQLQPEPFASLPPGFVIRAMTALRAAISGLARRLAPPQLVLLELMTSVGTTAMLAAVTRHDIADLLEQHGSLSAAAIAEARGLDADLVQRTLRALSRIGVFELRRDGSFANNRVSRELRSGQLSRMRESCLYFGSDSHTSAWLDFSRSLETGKSAFRRVHGMSVWEWFDAHPDERENFAHVMMGFTVMSASAIATLYPFGEVRRVCDVGGGRGTLLSELLIRHRHLEGVLAETEGVLESARTLLRDRGVLERAELVPASFFEQVPSGCDAYVLKHVLHDWDDEVSRRILQVVRAAMQPGARLLVCEALLDPRAPTRMHTNSDLQMHVVGDEGRERSLAEFRSLLAATGFRQTRVFPFPLVSVIEAEAV